MRIPTKSQKIIISWYEADSGLRWTELLWWMLTGWVGGQVPTGWSDPRWHRQGGTSSEGVSVSWAETVEQEESKTGRNGAVRSQQHLPLLLLTKSEHSNSSPNYESRKCPHLLVYVVFTNTHMQVLPKLNKMDKISKITNTDNSFFSPFLKVKHSGALVGPFGARFRQWNCDIECFCSETK